MTLVEDGMKKSARYQQKLDEIAERNRLHWQSAFIEEIEEVLGFSGEFVPSAAGIQVSDKPSNYVSSHCYLENPIEVIPNSSATKGELSRAYLEQYNKLTLKSHGLFYWSAEEFGGCWLKIDASMLKVLFEYVISKIDLNREFECLISSCESEEILALFDTEWEYLICKFGGKS